MIAIINTVLQDPDDRRFILDIYEKYKNMMFSTARKYIASQNDVEDIVQESLIRLMNKVGTLRPLECCTLAAYIVSTVRNTAINHLKLFATEKKVFVDVKDLDLTSIPFERKTLDEGLIFDERRNSLATIWPELSAAEQLLLSGKYILGYTDQELAGFLGCRKESVRMKLTRARRHALSLLIERGVDNDQT